MTAPETLSDLPRYKVRRFSRTFLPSGAPANDERVTATILNGHGLMPAMGNTMDQQDLDDLLAYLHTL